MTGKRFFAFLAALSLLALAMFGGGCGGGSSGGGLAAARYVQIGELATVRLDGSDLVPYIRERITESVDISNLSGAIDILGSLTARDVVFIGNADEDVPGDEEALMEFYFALLEAYNNGAAIVAVYPDSEDVTALEEMLKVEDIDLSRPNQDAKVTHFELLGVARRVLPNGTPHTFVYLDDSDSNYGGVISDDETLSIVSDDGNIVDVVLPDRSPEAVSSDLELTPDIKGDHEGDSTGSETGLTTKEVEAALHASRVQALLEWAAGLDKEAQNMVDEVTEAEAKLRTAASSGTDILSLVTGVTTTQPDNVSWSFKDYYEKFGKNDDNFKKFADKCDFDNSRLLNKYWSDFKVSRNTFSQYRVISMHSFEDHYDYYLVISQANTQPQSIAIRADKGTNNGGEVPGAGAYNYAVILGYTRGLWTDVQRVYVDGQRVHHLPDQTVNKDKSYTDTKGWSLSGGVSLKAGANDKGPFGEVGVNFSGSVSHTSSTTWKGQDYEIIPKPNGVWLASWLLDVDWPDYSKGWQISTAAKSSVTLDTESIWRTNSRDFALKGRASWWEGFSWCHDTLFGDSKYSCAMNHCGSWKRLSLPRPSRLALEKTSMDGGKEGHMYSTNLYAEGNWSATTDADWIEIERESTSGGISAGTPFYYTVSENNTGKMRTGHIMVSCKIGKITDTVTLKFVQSPYAK